jgi:tetratricopeptide (TPR) repeat protein
LQGRLEDAAKSYQELVSMNPFNRVARERLLGIYELLGKKDDIALMMDYIKENSLPGDQSRQAIGLFYLQNGQFSESISELDMIVTVWPEDQKSRYYLALAYEQNNQAEEALYHFRMIEEKNDLYINARLHIAYLLNKMEKRDEAIEVLKNTIEYKSDETDLYALLSSIYESNEDYKRAQKVLEQGLAVESESVELIYRLGALLDRKENKEGSIAQMRRVLELDPDNADAMNYIGYTYAEQGINLDEALTLIQKAISSKPDNGYYIDSLGWVYFQQEKYDLALESLEKAFSLIEGGDPTIAEHLGDAHMKLGNYILSLEMYQKALMLRHQDPESINRKIEEVRKNLE